jgi:hypothetical protein
MSEALYGYCPVCGSPGVIRERRPDGNDKCAMGHTYLTRLALKEPPPSTPTAPGDWVTVPREANEAMLEAMTGINNRSFNGFMAHAGMKKAYAAALAASPSLPDAPRQAGQSICEDCGFYCDADWRYCPGCGAPGRIGDTIRTPDVEALAKKVARGQAAASQYFCITRSEAIRHAKKAKRLMALAGDPLVKP